MQGSRTLGDYEGAIDLLEIRCTRCDRVGRLRLTRLIERYGKDTRLPDIRHWLSADCPHHDASLYERCDVYFPQLLAVR